MKRHLMASVAVGVLGLALSASEAQACHRKKCHCPTPCVAVQPCPPPPPAPCPPPVACKPKHHFKLCSFKMPKIKFHHAKGCAPAPAPCATGYAATVAWAPAPAYAAPVYGSIQAPSK